MKKVTNMGRAKAWYTPPFTEAFTVKLEGQFLQSYKIPEIQEEEEDW